MIGSTQFQYALLSALSAPVEKWEDSLETNHDDYVYVDGEEGDYGIVSYFGPDANGASVRMMVKYVHGGDDENTYYTQDGIDHILNVVMIGDCLPAAFKSALLTTLAPDNGEGGLRIGEIKAAKDADDLERRSADGKLN
jgi:hypothetical protein